MANYNSKASPPGSSGLDNKVHRDFSRSPRECDLSGATQFGGREKESAREFQKIIRSSVKCEINSDVF